MACEDPPSSECTLIALELQTCIKQGDKNGALHAIEALSGPLYPRLFEAAKRWNVEGWDVCDLVNEAWSHLQNKLLAGEDNYNPGKAQFETWALRVARNRWHDIAREQRRRREKELKLGERQEESEAGIDEGIFSDSKPRNPDAELFGTKEKQEAEELLKRMAKREPEVEQLLRAVRDGCKAKPTPLARWLGCSVDDVNNLFRRLRRGGWM